MQGKPRSAQVDIYSLGVVLYKVLAGREPFVGRSVHDVLQSQMHDDPPMPSMIRGAVPDGLQRMDRDPITPVETAAIADSIIPADRRELFEKNGEIDFAYSLRDVGRFRANVFMQRGTVGAAIRTIPFKILSSEELGLPPVVSSLANDLLRIAGNNALLLLVMCAITSLVLGLGLTTTACYIFLAVLVAPALEKLGLNKMAVHMFIFYWGMLSSITPPVAIASFAAAEMAGVATTSDQAKLLSR